MTLETFFDKFDLFADAPDAVAKMRELILESAIHGKLVPQDRRDEPASELLKRVASDQESQSKKRAAFAPVGDDAYLELPAGWEWTRLGNTGRIFNGDSVSESGKAELSKVAEGLPFIATKDVGYGRDVLAYENGLKVPLNDPRFKVARANAVLICAEGGSAGRKIGITDRDICFGNKLYANEVFAGIHHRYIFYIYQAPTFFREFAARMTGIIGGIARSEFLSLPIPLPPEREQKRIVAKVDELMALCDRLEAQQQERETRHAALARASLARFADAPTPTNLDYLFHSAFHIPPSELRKSILTLAVQGKLVPQDPSEEPAEKREVGAILTESDEPEIEPPFALPDSWQAARVREVLVTRQGVQIEKAEQVSEPKLGYKRYLYISDFKHDQKLKFVRDEHPTKEVTVDDLVMANTAGPGEIFRGVPGILSNNLFKISFAPTQFCQGFLFIYFTSPCFVEAVGAELKGGAQQHLGHKLMGKQFIPIPPLAEQRRIVAKVDELMAWVDALETQLATARTTATKLLEAAVHELTS
jgi:type I restriction enzyme, S subunit